MRPHVPDANLTGVSRLLPGCLFPDAQVCALLLSLYSIDLGITVGNTYSTTVLLMLAKGIQLLAERPESARFGAV
jgi:hypothetical protein